MKIDSSPQISQLGSTAEIFCEDEIVAGDIIAVELDPEVFRMMHEAIGVWYDNMANVSNFPQV